MHNIKGITLIVIFGLFLVTLNAQNSNVNFSMNSDVAFNSDLNTVGNAIGNVSTKGDWLFHLGVNVVRDPGGNKSLDIFNGDYSNFSNPLTVGIEYFNNTKFSFIGSVSLNKYIAGKFIDGAVILKDKEASYLSVDWATKYNFLQPLTSNAFEPYVFLGLGYTKTDSFTTSARTVPSVGRLTINSGFGANYWLSNSVGLSLNLAAKFGVKSEKYKEYISNHTQVSFSVFYSFKKENSWRS